MVDNDFLAAEGIGINFSYPDDYKNFLKNRGKINDTAWWLIGETKGYFNTCFKVINIEHKSSKLLVPFAKSDQSNILACFDESHRVWLTSCETNDITGADWNNRFSMPNFSVWLNKVLSYEIV